ADRNRSHWSTSKTPSYTKSVSWQHHRRPIQSSAESWRAAGSSTPLTTQNRQQTAGIY
ncbi:cytochrome b, partial [Escherichia coli]